VTEGGASAVVGAHGVSELPAATKLAVDRTRLAYDRTLLAWVRTATSLISFGFTIYNFFDYLRGDKAPAHHGLFGPREFAMVMIITGILALALATIDHRRHMVSLRQDYGLANVPYAMSTVLAGLIALLGVFGLLIVFFRQ
jgi:putative membrane protein